MNVWPCCENWNKFLAQQTNMSTSVNLARHTAKVSHMRITGLCVFVPAHVRFECGLQNMKVISKGIQSNYTFSLLQANQNGPSATLDMSEFTALSMVTQQLTHRYCTNCLSSFLYVCPSHTHTLHALMHKLQMMHIWTACLPLRSFSICAPLNGVNFIRWYILAESFTHWSG